MSYRYSLSVKTKTIVGILLALVIVSGSILLWAIAAGKFEYHADTEVELPPTTVTATPSALPTSQ